MGQVLTISPSGLDLTLYGDRSNLLTNYLATQMQNIQPAFNEFSKRLYDTMLSSYNFVTDKLTQYGIRNELNSQGLSVVDNYYLEALSWEQLQQANVTMQRWIMSQPTLRQMYVDQNTDGYSDTYQNVFGKGVKEEDYNWRMLMSGVPQYLDNGDHKVVHYLEDLMYGDKQLDHYEKDIIINTHTAIEWIIGNCNFDFTAVTEEPTKFNR